MNQSDFASRAGRSGRGAARRPRRRRMPARLAARAISPRPIACRRPSSASSAAAPAGRSRRSRPSSGAPSACRSRSARPFRWRGCTTPAAAGIASLRRLHRAEDRMRDRLPACAATCRRARASRTRATKSPRRSRRCGWRSRSSTRAGRRGSGTLAELADGFNNGALVSGPRFEDWQGIDFAEVDIVLSAAAPGPPARELALGSARAILDGDPFATVVMLANAQPEAARGLLRRRHRHHRQLHRRAACPGPGPLSRRVQRPRRGRAALRIARDQPIFVSPARKRLALST